MDLYIYETGNGRVADFRPYLDGRDHSFEDHRELAPDDPRWEKIRGLRDPVTQVSIGGTLRLVGRAQTTWRDVMLFPLAWEGGFDPVDWESEAHAPSG